MSAREYFIAKGEVLTHAVTIYMQAIDRPGSTWQSAPSMPTIYVVEFKIVGKLTRSGKFRVD